MTVSAALRMTLVMTIVAVAIAPAAAQGIDRRYLEQPTGGVALPLTPLAGEHDARAVSVNPGGLALLRGPELALAMELEDSEIATTAGQGVGGFLATAIGGGWIPRFAVGIGLEWLSPSRTQLAPDPGDPFRLTLSYATSLGAYGGLGVSWHHFRDDGPLDRVDTFDVGLSLRVHNYVAIGAVARDLSGASVAGVRIRPRYELELMTRPFGTDAVELAFGGRLADETEDLDGWGRLSARVARGFYVHAGIESRQVHAIIDSAMGQREDEGRELRAMLGVELSFGRSGVLSAVATGVRDDTASRHALGAGLVARFPLIAPPSVLGSADHIERVELTGTIGLRELTALVVRMRSIARDRSAKAVVVTFDGAKAGWATLQELRDELIALRRANKKVFAYMVSGTGRDYFVASAADKIYVDPAGGVRLVGIAGATVYLRGLFDMLGIVPQFEKIKEYKSAPEQFTEVGPSPTAARMMAELYDSLWDRWIAQVASSRKLPPEQLKALIDTGPFSAGDLAKDHKLVDAVAAPDKVAELVAKELGGMLPVSSPRPERPDRWRRPAIAVIYVDGDITDGPSRSIPFIGRKTAGSETLVGAIAAARSDPGIGAIVLRIDSPGGSAIASELIAREVFATRGVKPMLCSMSDVAASGGYFVAAGCDLIFAEPMTITGSIGIFYGKFDLSGLLHRLGINTVTEKRGKRADVESMLRPFTDDERVALIEQLRYSYSRFVGAVAEGRKMKKDEVDAVGRGHVWTGAQAQPIKLVDRFGGLGDAIEEAKRRMALPASAKVRIVELPRVETGLLGTLANLFGAHQQAPPMALTDLPGVQELLRAVPASVLVSPGGAQARMPFDADIE
ncbi:MAG: signal peptide peptidase SppA [Kofleriaceae bacterium]